MTDEITVFGPAGRGHIFPAGTRQEVIDRVMRFSDNVEDMWNTSLVAELRDALFPEAYP